jgi:dephospho-CoA kinase
MTYQYAIVLTGGIATGKSSVSKLLKEHGFDIIDADKVAHEMLDMHSDGIAALFGKAYVKEGKVLRKELAKIIFTNPENRSKLENFLHPLIQKEIESLASIYEKLKKPYIIDIPLFFETKNYDIERVALVYAPIKIQRERLMKRDGFTKEEADSRINSQISIELKKSKSTYIIDNSKEFAHLEDEVEKFISYIRSSHANH